MRGPRASSRGLTTGEAELWQRLTRSVTPLRGRAAGPVSASAPATKAAGTAPEHAVAPAQTKAPKRPVPVPVPAPVAAPVPVASHAPRGLDARWERRLARGLVEPDVTLDLHGATLDAAYHRLDRGLAQARVMDARLVLLVTGVPRPVEAADRGNRRGAIRAKVADWLAAGAHADAIAAIRGAHRRHGGQGALYLVLRRRR